jgi:hypothetical protein
MGNWIEMVRTFLCKGVFKDVEIFHFDIICYHLPPTRGRMKIWSPKTNAVPGLLVVKMWVHLKWLLRVTSNLKASKMPPHSNQETQSKNMLKLFLKGISFIAQTARQATHTVIVAHCSTTQFVCSVVIHQKCVKSFLSGSNFHSQHSVVDYT